MSDSQRTTKVKPQAIQKQLARDNKVDSTINEKLISQWRDPEVQIKVSRFAKPPARFIGGKRWARTVLADVLSSCGGGFEIAIDPFGGSGMISRAIKDSGMARRVVYGDFDGYADRVRYIQSPEGAARHKRVRSILENIKEKQAIPANLMPQIAAEFKHATNAELDVWLPYLSFSGRESAVRDLTALKRYNCTTINWPNANGWLDGLEIVSHTDARQIIASYLPFPQRTLVVLDPPYPGTHGASYRDSSWAIGNYVDIINTLLANGVDTIIAFGDNRSGVENMMTAVPSSKVKRFQFGIKTNGNSNGSTDSAYIIRTKS